MILSDEAIRLWETAKALNRLAARVSPRATDLPPLMFFTDPARTPRPWEIAGRLPSGAAVVHRGFGRPEAADEAARLREATRAGGVRLLIGLDLKLALSVGADGLHLPERALDRAAAARSEGVRLVTGAAHSAEALARAARAGVDAVVISPVFDTRSDSGGTALGPDGVRRLAEQTALPAYALGGIMAANADDLTDSGVCGLCAIDGIIQAFGPETTPRT